jgi:hypothetical protein
MYVTLAMMIRVRRCSAGTRAAASQARPAAGHSKLPGRAVSAPRALVPRLCRGSHVIPALTSYLAGYLTVYLTVLLVSPFPAPTVAVTRSSGPQERD